MQELKSYGIMKGREKKGGWGGSLKCKKENLFVIHFAGGGRIVIGRGEILF